MCMITSSITVIACQAFVGCQLVMTAALMGIELEIWLSYHGTVQRRKGAWSKPEIMMCFVLKTLLIDSKL